MAVDSHPTNDLLFESLTKSVRSGRCIAILGAGMSAGDYPPWSTLLHMLRDGCSIRAEDLSSADPLDIAEAAKRKDQDRYHLLLDETFARKESPKSAPRYHLLARIEFASYITLNFDPLLADILDLHRNITVSAYPWIQDMYHGNRELFYVHGRLGPGYPAAKAKIVLTRAEFDQAYDPYGSRLHGFLQSTFLDHDVCFIGCNPVEANLERLLRACQSFCKGQYALDGPSPPHWFLLSDDAAEMPNGLDDCGIRLVRYPRVDVSFLGLDRVLEYWAGRRTPVVREPGTRESVYRGDVEPGQ
ncbi:MAG: SIR2 family protein [Phycisphaerae bacterium]|nr:SIR2 family protein [Phycisphaerae bacterium]